MNVYSRKVSSGASDDEALPTRCGGQGAPIFFGMAKPARAPPIGPARPY